MVDRLGRRLARPGKVTQVISQREPFQNRPRRSPSLQPGKEVQEVPPKLTPFGKYWRLRPAAYGIEVTGDTFDYIGNDTMKERTLAVVFNADTLNRRQDMLSNDAGGSVKADAPLSEDVNHMTSRSARICASVNAAS